MDVKNVTYLKTYNPVDGIRVEVREELIAVVSDTYLRTLSSAVYNGGFQETTIILNCHVDMNYDHVDPKGFIENAAKKACFSPDGVVGLMTGVNSKDLAIVTKNHQGLNICTIVTAGVSNSTNAAKPRPSPGNKPGTINIILIIDGNLPDACMVEVVKVITEAKTVALLDLDIRSQYSYELASGTSTDSVVVSCSGKGRLVEYAGPATVLGGLIGVSVYEAVMEAVHNTDGLAPGRPLVTRLNERGITLDDLVETALELYIAHPGVETREKATDLLMKNFKNAFLDPNLTALVVSGLRLEEDGGRGLIPGLSAEIYRKDPSFIVADEVLGMAIADYIAGTRGVFEFVRFDNAKPGILKHLNPILDDVIGGLVAGVSSKMYIDALENLMD